MNSKELRRQKRRADGTDHGRAPDSSGGTTQWSQATNLPTVFIFGVEGVEDYVNKLADSLGPDCGVHTTESFCQSEACSPAEIDRKSTRLNSSHLGISYAVFCL